MRHELSLLGVYAPSLVLCALLAAALWFLADWLMLKGALWRFFWHPPLARLALYFVLFGAVSALYPDF
ncbi:DUF1656 domain-containing protein [Fulvimarina sp. 2208YS6-2-32]|uniref:DUF1656 domain-containing protein n=1 Tax=Fulvimarina uroteuthidis TaxID=3098149 RepID=A0ABU5HYM7_9HYPH|nr:DUF1656 domain-containing protein [Fulvimarina sp. 2208YS6-2-32]MDY8107997.1 DUF1656 domain-containing protein [Fulvimarina sp. 2208YS6-2-32]